MLPDELGGSATRASPAEEDGGDDKEEDGDPKKIPFGYESLIFFMTYFSAEPLAFYSIAVTEKPGACPDKLDMSPEKLKDTREAVVEARVVAATTLKTAAAARVLHWKRGSLKP